MFCDPLLIHISNKFSHVNFIGFFNTAFFQDELGLTLPNWAISIYPNKTEDSFTEYIASRMGTMKLKRLLGG